MPKKKREYVPVPRPLLSDLIYQMRKLAGRSMTLDEWNTNFYNLSIMPTAPRCLEGLYWEWKDQKPFCHELTHMVMFAGALEYYPNRE